MKIAYIHCDTGSQSNGANTVMSRNLKALKEIAGTGNVVTYTLPKSGIKNVLKSILRMGSYGVTKKTENEVMAFVHQENPDWIFIESSSYGSLFKRLNHQSGKTICFAHNVDTVLAKQEISSRAWWISIPKYLLTRHNEAVTARYADKLICLNNRDSEGFRQMFGRTADAIMPITFPERPEREVPEFEMPYFLFVGSNFFPNIEGIEWFIREVAPHVDRQFHVVGSCCDGLRNLALPPNVKLLGYVEDLDLEYRQAAGVIAPIFKGSGMKTKTIEALSYGKSIYGTDEAFAGIEGDLSRIGGRCNTAAEFIESLSSSSDNIVNEYSQLIFSNGYSDDSFKARMEHFLGFEP